MANMNRRDVVKYLIILFGTILLVLTAVEYLIRVYSVTLDPVFSYWIQIVYLLSIFLFLIVLVIYIEVRMRSES